MVKIESLYDNLIDMGHSEEWAKKKVQLTKIDNDLENLSIKIDKCFNLDHKAELQFQYDAICDIREKVFNELSKIKDY